MQVGSFEEFTLGWLYESTVKSADDFLSGDERHHDRTKITVEAIREGHSPQ